MDLAIIEVNKNQQGKEYILLKVLVENTNLRKFALTDSTFNDEGDLSNKQRHFFKFPAKEVVKDQQIVVFTEPITHPQGHVNNNTVFYSWKLGHEVWNNSGDTATLIEIADSKSKNVKE